MIKIKDKWLKTIIDSLKIINLLVIIGLSAWIATLIIPTNFSYNTAENVGYAILGVIIGFCIFEIILMIYSMQEKQDLIIQREVDKRKVKELEEELLELQKR